MESDLIAYAEDLEALNAKWQPLDWQIGPVQALFYHKIKDIGAQCGRSSGKTEMLSYCHWRYAREVPNSESYIFEPLQKQAREILWASKRIQNFGPAEFIQSINNTEMRITFKNGSFLKLDGSDNVDSLRGIKPRGLISYDELKDHKQAFLDAMEPNRARYNAPALYLGTPPEVHNHYVDIMEILKADKTAYWCTATSYDNTHNDKSFLDRTKAKLLAMDLEDTWLREYMAVFVKGGKRSIFPWVLKQDFPSFAEIKPKDINKWSIIVGFDPASTSVFGVVFTLFNPYTRKLIVFDELYIDQPHKMTAKEVYLSVKEKLEPFRGKVKSIDYVYDEAAAWFRNEMFEIDSNLWLTPSCKSNFGVDGYINLVRNVMHFGLLTICKEAPKLIWEMESYIKDESGKIPKRDDHNINAFQYLCGSLGLDFTEKPEVVQLEKEERRAFSPDNDFNVIGDFSEIG